jgi:hypothetical protein
MPGCVLHVTGEKLDPKTVLADLTLEPYSVYHKGDKVFREHDRVHPLSGFSCDVSAPSNELAQEIAEATAFLTEHENDLRRLGTTPGVNAMLLDFGYGLRIDGEQCVVQRDFLPPAFVRLCGSLGIGITLSLYPPPGRLGMPRTDSFHGRRNMFQRYTEKARRVIFSARYMASRVGSPDIDTEHILLGLLTKDKGLARRFLGSPWAAEEVWKVVEQIKPIREKMPGPKEIPLTIESKRVLTFALEEADLVSNKHVCSEHLLLGLLREEKSFAARILCERGIDLISIRADLARIPHDDSATENFVRERASSPEDVVELQTHITSIRKNIYDAIAENDFTKARTFSDEEGQECDELFLLYRKHGLNDWLFD